jgi:hypothetical protein
MLLPTSPRTSFALSQASLRKLIADRMHFMVGIRCSFFYGRTGEDIKMGESWRGRVTKISSTRSVHWSKVMCDDETYSTLHGG